MNKYVNPKFLKAFKHYEAMAKKYGENHPKATEAFLTALNYAPEHIKAEIDAKAKELNLLPPPSGYGEDGSPIYKLEDMAQHLSMSYEEAERHLFDVMNNRQKARLSNEGIVINSNTHLLQ